VPAAARHVKVECRIGAVGRDHRRARLDRELHRQPKQAVDALADDDVVEPDAVELGERGAQLVTFGIGVHPIAVRRGAHGGKRLRRGAEQTLVGAKPRAERLAAAALLRLRADERHEGGQAFDEAAETRSRHTMGPLP
jgi:hypothetical protein